MKAILYEQFNQLPTLQSVPDPSPADDGVVIRVEANGICRSDWHGWAGHDPDIVLPHVPGHELSGEIVAVGKQVQQRNVGERVTVRKRTSVLERARISKFDRERKSKIDAERRASRQFRMRHSTLNSLMFGKMTDPG